MNVWPSLWAQGHDKAYSKALNGEVGYKIGSAIKNLGLFSKSPGDFKMETMDF